jgi:hypothetical protein
MAFTRDQLEAELTKLDDTITCLMAEFWNGFASAADFATECASAADVEWVNGRIDDLLRTHNIVVPSDEPPVDG